MTPVESHLAALHESLQVSRRDRRRIVTEVRDHLLDDVAARERGGDAPRAAAEAAVAAFGDPVDIARRFNALAGTRDARRATVALGATGAAVAAGFVLAAARQSGSRSVPAPLWLPVLFFAARVAFEIALVAGVCAAAHTLAFGGAATVPSSHRRAVRRAVTIGTLALGLAAAGLLATLFAALERYGVSDRSRLVAGAALVAIAVPAAGLAWRRFRGNDQDDHGAFNAAPHGVCAIGERVLAGVRGHPALACGVVAAASMISAMSAAESTMPAALSWGVVQAACVIVAFVFLGPRLGLRRDPASASRAPSI
jgi:hypothetical protein